MHSENASFMMIQFACVIEIEDGRQILHNAVRLHNERFDGETKQSCDITILHFAILCYCGHCILLNLSSD